MVCGTEGSEKGRPSKNGMGGNPTTDQCNQLLGGMRNEYQPKCSEDVWIGSKGKYGSVHLWINVWVASKTV